MADDKKKDNPELERPSTTDIASEALPASSISSSLSTDSRQDLLEKAAKFLEDVDVSLSSDAEKRRFLSAKGLADGEIDDLLKNKRQTIAPSLGRSETMSTEDSTQASSSAEAATSKDSPPIITYPEFLFHTQKPAPLVTTQRLITTAYLAGGAVAAMYGINEYLMQPMIQSMSEARHSLFEITTSKTNQLNEKLSAVVSKIPPGAEEKEGNQEDHLVAGASPDAEPSSFFTHSIGTQTSPGLAKSSEDATSTDSREGVESSSPIPPDFDLDASLKRMDEILAELRQSIEANDPVDDQVHDLTTYMDTLRTWGKSGQIEPNPSAQSDLDGIAKVKAEIKGVKGALLSARNFPARTAAATAVR